MNRFQTIKMMLKEGVPVYIITGVIVANIVGGLIFANINDGINWFTLPTAYQYGWLLGLGTAFFVLEIIVFYGIILPVIDRYNELREAKSE